MYLAHARPELAYALSIITKNVDYQTVDAYIDA